MDIRAEIQTRVDEIEQIIKRYLPEEEGWQKTIMEAMNYSILAGGKTTSPDVDVGDLSSVWWKNQK